MTPGRCAPRRGGSPLIRWGAAGLAAAAVLAVAATGCGSGAEVVPGGPSGHYTVPAGIHKIKHVIVIQQENRSFDSYFGTFPGADGIPDEERQARGVRARSSHQEMRRSLR